jgi:hypothetical protein
MHLADQHHPVRCRAHGGEDRMGLRRPTDRRGESAWLNPFRLVITFCISAPARASPSYCGQLRPAPTGSSTWPSLFCASKSTDLTLLQTRLVQDFSDWQQASQEIRLADQTDRVSRDDRESLDSHQAKAEPCRGTQFTVVSYQLPWRFCRGLLSGERAPGIALPQSCSTGRRADHH